MDSTPAETQLALPLAAALATGVVLPRPCGLVVRTRGQEYLLKLQLDGLGKVRRHPLGGLLADIHGLPHCGDAELHHDRVRVPVNYLFLGRSTAAEEDGEDLAEKFHWYRGDCRIGYLCIGMVAV